MVSKWFSLEILIVFRVLSGECRRRSSQKQVILRSPRKVAKQKQAHKSKRETEKIKKNVDDSQTKFVKGESIKKIMYNFLDIL